VRGLLDGQTFALAITLLAYVAGGALFRRTGWWLLHPVVVATTTIAVALRLLGIEPARYGEGARLIGALLAPSVVALGLTLHDQRRMLDGRAARLVCATGAGSAVGVVTAVLVGRALGGSRVVVASLAPKSVTTPIAMGISERLGGSPPLTGAVVIAVGVFGAVVGPPLLRAIGVRGAVPLGVAMGSAAHGIGTARAVQEGQAEGAASALAIGLCGVFTALLAPPFMWLLGLVWPWAP
jgi:putative effector of murein hydrolase